MPFASPFKSMDTLLAQTAERVPRLNRSLPDSSLHALPRGRKLIHFQFQYRFAKCGELCLGLFTSGDAEASSLIRDLPTTEAASPVDSSSPDRKQILLAHCVVTKSRNDVVQDEDMEIPKDWQSVSR